MNTYLTYGAAIALCNALVTFGLYFAGFHADASKLQIANIISIVTSLIICVTCVVLGTRARRAESPPAEEFSYGRALGTGVLIMLFASLFGMITTFLYAQVINPGLTDLILQSQATQMEAKGMSAAQIEQMQKVSRLFVSPGMQAVFAFVGSMIFGTIISLITSACLKRSAFENGGQAA
jgi:hypothetical protein